MNRDFLLAIALSFLVLLASRYFLEPYFQPVEPKPDVEQASRQTETPQPPVEVTHRAPPKTPTLGLTQPRTAAAEKEQLYSVETDLFKLSISNRGAVVKEWVLKRYLDGNDEALNLIDPSQPERTAFPLALRVQNEPEISAALGKALFRSDSPLRVNLSHGGARSRSLEFQYAGGRVQVMKKLTFAADSYEVGVDCTVSVDGQSAGYFLLWQGGFGDATLENTWAKRQLFYQGQEEINRMEAGDLESQQDLEGNFRFLGVEDHYFAAVFLPATLDGIRRIHLARYTETSPEEEEFSLRMGVRSSEQGSRFRLFVGPKDTKVLPEELQDLIDYGWFAFLCKPLFYLLSHIYSVVGNYGLAIIILTVIINAVLFPLRYKSVVASQKMQKIQPKMKAIQEKYKKLKTTDPKRQQMNSEVMALYKQHGVNPLGGCLPLLLQMPFLFAFYSLLNVAIELRQAPFFAWIQDLSAPDPTYILPILMVASMMLMQKMTPMPSADPLQAKMMLFMPLIFGFMMATQSSGLVLYWFTSNLVNILQQLGMNRYGPGAAVNQEKASSTNEKNATKATLVKAEVKGNSRRSKRRKARSSR